MSASLVAARSRTMIDFLLDSGRLVQASALMQAKARAHASRLLQSNHGEPIGVVARSRRRSAWAAILPEMSCPDEGPCRIQFFDEAGFSGHSVCRSEGDALGRLVREGYVVSDPMALDRLAAQWIKNKSGPGGTPGPQVLS